MGAAFSQPRNELKNIFCVFQFKNYKPKDYLLCYWWCGCCLLHTIQAKRIGIYFILSIDKLTRHFHLCLCFWDQSGCIASYSQLGTLSWMCWRGTEAGLGVVWLATALLTAVLLQWITRPTGCDYRLLDQSTRLCYMLCQTVLKYISSHSWMPDSER